MGVSRCLTPYSFMILFAKKLISAYQTEQDYAEGKYAVPDEKHQYHSNGNPEKYKTQQTFHRLLLRVCLIYYMCGKEKNLKKKVPFQHEIW